MVSSRDSTARESRIVQGNVTKPSKLYEIAPEEKQTASEMRATKQHTRQDSTKLCLDSGSVHCPPNKLSR